MFKLYFGQGSSVTIAADSLKEAINKFRKWCPDVVFMTEEGMARAQAAAKAREEAAQEAAEPVLKAAE